MNALYLEEPELEFGGGKHVDIRFGITNYGPLDVVSPLAPNRINLGIVGSNQSVEQVRAWFDRCRKEIPAKSSKSDPGKPNKQPNLFTRFPGFNPETGFRSTLVMQDALCRGISESRITEIGRLPSRNDRIARAVDLFIAEIQHLAQNTDAKVIVCAVPVQLLEVMEPAGTDDEEGDEATASISGPDADFHDKLKAHAMQQYCMPIQIVLPPTYGGPTKRRNHSSRRIRELQDEATRAWNIHTAIYYKARGVPWRLPREATELTVCYVGVSFYRSLDQGALLTSVAQVFNERGEGVVVRGGSASVSKQDLQPHLPQERAYELLKEAFARYRDEHRTQPARVVVHKSSRFDSDEKRGFEAALREGSISSHDLLWISQSDTKLYRAGKYPPLRGTVLRLDDREMVLYTRGSVDFFETYPGRYVPTPLRIRSESTEQTQRFLANEILALSKMNWNNTQFDGAEPVTLQASRKCSNILRYCSAGRAIEPRYSFYM
jgi:hypothetical protein